MCLLINKNKRKNISFIGLNIGSAHSGYIVFVAASSTIHISADTLNIWTYTTASVQY
jgi:hypothetical protein